MTYRAALQMFNSPLCTYLAGYAPVPQCKQTSGNIMTVAAQQDFGHVLFVDLRGYTRLAERLPPGSRGASPR